MRALGFVLLTGSLSAQAVPPPAELQPVRAQVRRSVAAGDLPGLAVAAIRDGACVWMEAFGDAEVDGRRPATTATVYRLGAISELVTGLAVLRLARQGLVELDAPANRILDKSPVRSLAGDADAVTLRSLLCHRSGLPAFTSWMTGSAPGRTEPDVIARHACTIREPGRVRMATALDAVVLAQVITMVTGKRWQEFVIDDIATPLGLTSVRIGPPATPNDDDAVDYRRSADSWEPMGPVVSEHEAASGMRGSVRDVARLARLVLGVTSAETFDADDARSLLASAGDAWLADTHVDVQGPLPGAFAALRLWAEPRSAVAVLANADGETCRKLLEEIGSRLVDDRGWAIGLGGSSVEPDLAGTWTGTLDGQAVEMVVHGESDDVALDLTSLRLPANQATLEDSAIECHWTARVEPSPRVPGAAVLELALHHRSTTDTLTGLLRQRIDGWQNLPFALTLHRVADPDRPPSVAAIVPDLRALAFEVRQRAATALLRRLDEHAARTALADALHDDDPDVQDTVFDAIATQGDLDALGLVVDATRDAWLRERAWTRLATLAPTARAGIDALHEAWTARRIRPLRQGEPLYPGTAALAALRNLTDPAPDVRAAALGALGYDGRL